MKYKKETAKDRALRLAARYQLEMEVQEYHDYLLEDADNMYSDTPTMDDATAWDIALAELGVI